MTATLDDVTQRKKPEPSAEELAATELVRLAKEQGLSLTGPDGLLMRTPKQGLRHGRVNSSASDSFGGRPALGGRPGQSSNGHVRCGEKGCVEVCRHKPTIDIYSSSPGRPGGWPVPG